MLKGQKPSRLYVNGRSSGNGAESTGKHVLSWGAGAGSNVGLGEKTMTKGRAAGGALTSRVDNELSSQGSGLQKDPHRRHPGDRQDVVVGLPWHGEEMACFCRVSCGRD